MTEDCTNTTTGTSPNGAQQESALVRGLDRVAAGLREIRHHLPVITTRDRMDRSEAIKRNAFEHGVVAGRAGFVKAGAER